MSLAIVLSGGGARGAYEAGVLRFLFETLPRRAGERFRPAVVCGTSAGALNGAAAVAGVAGGDAVARLSRTWTGMRVDDVFAVTACDLATAPARTLGSPFTDRPSLVDAAPFRAMVHRVVPWKAVSRALDRGDVDAFAVTATDVDTGTTTVFVDRAGQHVPLAFPHPELTAVAAQVGPDHCLASAAMPFLFPPVQVGDRLLVDGGLRLNTPLSPALHLGADRLLVVGTQGPLRPPRAHLHAADLSLGFLVGKALNALMLDPVEQDLRRLGLLNEVFSDAATACGPDFLDRLNAVAAPRRGAPFRRVESLLVRPSEDLGALAGVAWRSGKVRVSGPAHVLFSAVAAAERGEEADLLSFLLFDRVFTAEIEHLGHRDAEAQESRIAALVGLGG